MIQPVKRGVSVVLFAGALLGCDLTERMMELAQGPPAPRKSEPKERPPAFQADDQSTLNRLPQIDAGHSGQGAPMSFANLAKTADPAVVFVRTIRSQRQGFRRLLTDASGSGFVFDPGGKILTNYHVIKGAQAISVEFNDGTALIAQLVGADPLTDLAVLQVARSGLTALPLGDSDKVSVGDWAVAIGNPYGLEHTVSAGIISAKERTGQQVDLGNPEAYYSFLQTDASINPGNSGGPLLDLSGSVIGINTAINAAANNIGFAIPINMVKRLLPRLLAYGKIDRAAFGVFVDDVAFEDLERFRLPDRNGAFIAKVVPRSPAEAAGLQAGDVVVSVGEHQVRTPSEFRWNASLSSVGEKVNLGVLRGGKKITLEIVPAPMAQR